jgi:gliding motility-associated-like protein
MDTVQLSDANFNMSVARTNLCDPLILRVTHTAPMPYSFQVFDASSGGGVVASGTPSTPGTFDTPGLPSGNYLIQVTSGGCIQVDGPQTYQQDQQVPITGSSADGCVNPVTLSVSVDLALAPNPTFSWVGPNITSATNVASITATPPQGLQSYTVTVGAPGFCPIDFPVPVQVDNATIPAIAQSDACSDLVTINVTPGTGPYLYRWFRNGSLDAGLGGPQQSTPFIINGEQYQVQLFNSVSGCTYDTPPLDLLVVGDITVTLTSTAACEGSPFTITATTPQPVTSYQWELDGALLNGQTNSTLTDTRAGVYTAIVGLTGCVDDEDIQVLLAPLTPGSLNDRAIICDDPANTDPNTNQVLLNPGSSFISYDWFKDGVSLGVTDPTFTATEAGLYSVELLNSFNCPSNDRTQVDIECLPKITGPNAFRPDGTVNPDFFLYTFFIDDSGFEIHIFNRWGELVYQSVDRLFRWNGGYNNVASRPLPPGTYSYVVRYRSSYRPEDGIQEKRGGVVLLR